MRNAAPSSSMAGGLLQAAGERRPADHQFPIAGDLVGLRSFLLQVPDYSVVALTDVSASEFAPKELTKMLRERPRLAAALMWMTSRDEAIIVQHLVGVGRRAAIERVAHFLLELGERLAARRLQESDSFECPLTQLDLADALGLTAIHVNRVLRALRERGFVTVSRRRVEIHDLEGLKRVAGFDRSYLQPSNALRSDPGSGGRRIGLQRAPSTTPHRLQHPGRPYVPADRPVIHVDPLGSAQQKKMNRAERTCSPAV